MQPERVQAHMIAHRLTSLAEGRWCNDSLLHDLSPALVDAIRAEAARLLELRDREDAH